jgi:hypothetical protein
MRQRRLRRWLLIGVATMVLASVVTGTVLVAGARVSTGITGSTSPTAERRLQVIGTC